MVQGEKHGRDMVLKHFHEKPSIDFAKEKKCKYGVFGCFVFTKEIFNFIDINFYEKGEIQLSTAIDKLIMKNKMDGYIIKGESFDIGTPEKYYETFCKFNKSF